MDGSTVRPDAANESAGQVLEIPVTPTLDTSTTHSKYIEPHLVEHLVEVYGHRFAEVEARQKDLLWREITRYLQRYVPRDGSVLDIACDRGDFIRNISAREKWATDIRDVSAELPTDVRFVQSDGLTVDRSLPNHYFDAVFMSNYLEHLPSSYAVIDQFRAVGNLLNRGGRIIVLQPNVRLVGGKYWNFIDHRMALTEKSLEEAARLAGFETQHMVTRFLPFTTKSRLPTHPLLVRAYLSTRPAWLLFGKQSLWVGRLAQGQTRA